MIPAVGIQQPSAFGGLSMPNYYGGGQPNQPIPNYGQYPGGMNPLAATGAHNMNAYTFMKWSFTYTYLL